MNTLFSLGQKKLVTRNTQFGHKNNLFFEKGKTHFWIYDPCSPSLYVIVVLKVRYLELNKTLTWKIIVNE